ncbi:hypothetical protein [Paenibacillus rhizophilus]|nr:hypothetical protein [Paenibacillus rhizophilus]
MGIKSTDVQGKNPGLSPQAWQNFHRKMAEMNVKYQKQIQDNLLKKSS